MKPPKSSNCQPTIEMNLLEMEDATFTFSYSSSNDSTSVESEGDNETPTKAQEVISLENCTLKYLSGYVAKKCIEKFNCSEC